MATHKQVQLIAHLLAKPGKEAALESALLAALPAIHAEPGCVAYVPHVSLEHPHEIVIYEIWENAETHAAHKAGIPLGRLKALFSELLVKPHHVEPLCRLD